MVVNGKTWPYLEVEQGRYRFRLLNGSQARVLILKMDNGLPFWQIGSEGGFLPKPVRLTQLLIAPAERADVVVDFSKVPAGTRITLQNVGPDEPCNGSPLTPADPGAADAPPSSPLPAPAAGATPAPAPGQACSGCGTALAPGAPFCAACGTLAG